MQIKAQYFTQVGENICLVVTNHSGEKFWTEFTPDQTMLLLEQLVKRLYGSFDLVPRKREE